MVNTKYKYEARPRSGRASYCIEGGYILKATGSWLPHGILFSIMETHPSYAGPLTHFLALGAIVGGIIAIVWALYLVAMFYQKKENSFIQTVSRFILPLGFFGSFFGMSLSLFYSEVLHYAPCDLCWYQRIFLYPQAFLFAYAWYKHDRSVLPYALILSCVGFSIGVYHHMLQIGFDLMKPCSTAPFAVDCSKPSFIEYGFVTFPLMSFVLSSFLILLVVTSMISKKRA